MGAGKTVDAWDAWTERMQAEHGNGNGHGKSLAIEAQRMFRTPTAQLAVNGGSQHPDKRKDGGHGPPLADEVEHLLPTPKATNNENRSSDWANGPNLGEAISQLLPTPRATDGTKGGPNQRGSSGDLMLPSAVQKMLPTPAVADVQGGRKGRSGDRSDELLLNGLAASQDWREYEAAIRRQEHAFGRPAPLPTEPGKNGQPRLSPLFVEWLMGLPAGHVTDPAIGISRNDQLKALGNGVVPQQAAAATRAFVHDISKEMAA
jgi:DNA (cytosine-5)-methyltransferase 1